MSLDRIDKGVDRGKKTSLKSTADVKRKSRADFRPGLPPKHHYRSALMRHAIDTFGSEKAAREWLSIECGALHNQTPADFIKKTGNEAEVERILNCIDYGMIA